MEFSDKTVILDINVTDVSSFQSAVSLEKAQIAISYLTAVPSATASPEEPHTDTPIPKAWPDPITNYLYLEIAADNSVGALNIGSQGRLLVIEKSLQIEGTPVAELSTEVVNECVLIIDFLDENSVRQGSYMSGKTKQVFGPAT